MYSQKVDEHYQRVKVPLNKISTLKKNNVLAIAITHKGELCGRAYGKNTRNLPKGLAYGTDFYALIITAYDSWYLDCWDLYECNHYGRSLVDPSGPQIKIPAVARHRKNDTVTKFSGIYIQEKEWKLAMIQMDKYMRG